jgi:hypothetical protein
VWQCSGSTASVGAYFESLRVDPVLALEETPSGITCTAVAQ